MPLASVFNPVTHVIFDVDGLLYNTEPIYEDSVREICQSYGKEFPLDVRLKVLGTTEQKTAAICINELSLPLSIEEFLTKQDDIVRVKLKCVDLMKGGERLIRHFHEHNIPFCVGSSSGDAATKLKFSSRPDISKLFSHFVTGSTDPEVKNGKPAPDIFLIAARRFKDNPDPSKCLVFEDSPNGVEAARSANMQVVMVPDDVVPDEKRAKATIVLKSLEDFQPELFGLPGFKDKL